MNKLNSNRLESYEGQNAALTNKFAPGPLYEPLTQNQTYQPPSQGADGIQNQAYPRTSNIYSSTSHTGYRNNGNGGINDNLSPYHHGPPQPPNYEDTVNNLYRRLSSDPAGQYHSKAEQARSFGNLNSMQHSGYSDYNAYSSDNSPVHLYEHKQANMNTYMSAQALRQSVERLNKYHNYDIDKEYPPEDIYKAPGDYSTYGHLYHKGNLDLSDPDLAYMEVRKALFIIG